MKKLFEDKKAKSKSFFLKGDYKFFDQKMVKLISNTVCFC